MPNFRTPLIAGLVFAAASLAALAPARAGTILQDQHNFNSTIFFHEPFGQSFTAEDANIAAIAFYVTDANAHVGPDFSIVMHLYAGVGDGGTLLATKTNATALSDGFHGYLDFDFSDVPLTVGDSYTAFISNDTHRWAVDSQLGGDPYAGGVHIRFGTIAPDDDIRFRVTPAEIVAAPEPGTLAALGVGLAGLAGLASRRRRR